MLRSPTTDWWFGQRNEHSIINQLSRLRAISSGNKFNGFCRVSKFYAQPPLNKKENHDVEEIRSGGIASSAGS
jgi:hypothetical protein